MYASTVFLNIIYSLFVGSAEGGVGFPNIVHEPGFSVEGCVYELSLDCLPLLDTCVGFPKVYMLQEIQSSPPPGYLSI